MSETVLVTVKSADTAEDGRYHWQTHAPRRCRHRQPAERVSAIVAGVARKKLPGGGRVAWRAMVPFNVIALGDGRFSSPPTSGDIIIERDDGCTAQQALGAGGCGCLRPTTSPGVQWGQAAGQSLQRASTRWPTCRLRQQLGRSAHWRRLFRGPRWPRVFRRSGPAGHQAGVADGRFRASLTPPVAAAARRDIRDTAGANHEDRFPRRASSICGKIWQRGPGAPKSIICKASSPASPIDAGCRCRLSRPGRGADQKAPRRGGQRSPPG